MSWEMIQDTHLNIRSSLYKHFVRLILKKNVTSLDTYGKAEILDDQRTSQSQKHPPKQQYIDCRLLTNKSRGFALVYPKTKRSTDHSLCSKYPERNLKYVYIKFHRFVCVDTSDSKKKNLFRYWFRVSQEKQIDLNG